jgi:hypothetical protein
VDCVLVLTLVLMFRQLLRVKGEEEEEEEEVSGFWD